MVPATRLSDVPYIMITDAYKYGHAPMFPEGSTKTSYYLEARAGIYPETLWVGLQALLKEYLSKPVTMEWVEYADLHCKLKGLYFPRDLWEQVVTKYGGFPPIKIRALREGSIVPLKVPLMVVESTDKDFIAIPGFLETLLENVWHPTCIGTISMTCRNVNRHYLEKTSVDWESHLLFMTHDFGARSSTSPHSSGLGGFAHAVPFRGSDTEMADMVAEIHYGHKASEGKVATFSVVASEHSPTIAWTREKEHDFYDHIINYFILERGYKLISIVADSYDIDEAIVYLATKKDLFEHYGAKLVIRPDTGEPVEMALRCLNAMKELFGYTINPKGYVEIKNAGILYGDQVRTPMVQRNILEAITNAGFSAKTIVFGMGSGLSQSMERDTLGVAYKLSAIIVNGEARLTFKQPKDAPFKKSKKGFLDVIRDIHGNYQVIEDSATPGEFVGSELVTVYENGKFFNETTLEKIRERFESEERRLGWLK